jgi:hypothetical protein
MALSLSSGHHVWKCFVWERSSVDRLLATCSCRFLSPIVLGCLFSSFRDNSFTPNVYLPTTHHYSQFSHLITLP